MPAILRIDVDRNLFLKRKALPTTFLPSVKTLTKNILILFSFSTGFLFGKKKKCMIKELNDRGIKASLFFQPFTVPNKDFAQDLLKEGHSVGLHAVHTKDYKDFSLDLNKISRRSDGEGYGFTKDGSGKFKLSRRHDPNYGPAHRLFSGVKRKIKL